MAHATLLDQGICLASPATFVRVVKERGVQRKSGVRKPKTAKRPELVATAPGQVWCWDISVLQKHETELAMS